MEKKLTFQTAAQAALNNMKMEYISSLTNYNRNVTNEVKIGGVKIGGDNEIVVQTMCNTPTDDVEKTV
ncbi:MAG: flavodoxin-dependent (E)-4-hydroxy-3-methylbut-2-enyl-diphosphate synthase, partial [Bacteroidales bacterium]|nr:flavodoxin-dependent (E)-4-hydroxy-3-methylbut-2-enyl-diphosphate synthase [Bacteroidales bacterium]